MTQPKSLSCLPNIKVTGIANDSREVRSGDLFVAYPGEQSDGRDYISQAIKNGASAILYEPNDFNNTLPNDIPCIAIENLKERQGEIAAEFYDDPTKSLTTIGVTGTNGKTTVTQFISQALIKPRCGVIGTLGYGFAPDITPASLTTPDAIQLQKYCHELKTQGAEAIALEVSSHGLVQQRVKGVHFDIAVFTNITREHLDYHGDMNAYKKAKKMLFEQPGLKHAVINIDDEFGVELANTFSKTLNVITYSIKKPATISVPELHPESHGFNLMLATPNGTGQLQTPLLGYFNVSNLLAVMAVLHLQEVPLQQAIQSLSELTTVPGRMQTLGGDDKPLVVIDYAHTPDALSHALETLQMHSRGRLWCVFGCGGDRDRGKRAQMATVAERSSDCVIITSDNPRSESPEQIFDDIRRGFSKPDDVYMEPDRAQAIAHAIQQATVDDVILIAGKGHEDYQLIGHERFPFSDSQVAIEQLQSLT